MAALKFDAFRFYMYSAESKIGGLMAYLFSGKATTPQAGDVVVVNMPNQSVQILREGEALKVNSRSDSIFIGGGGYDPAKIAYLVAICAGLDTAHLDSGYVGHEFHAPLIEAKKE